MSVFRLVLREILYRKVNFGLGVLSVLAAVGCLVAVLAVLRLHDLRTEELVAVKEAEVKERGRKLEDDYRKIMLNLSFNIEIYPKGQNRDFFADDYAARTMPEEYARRLGKAKVVTINHLQPSLYQRITWPERKRTIILEGVRDEVPIGGGKQKKQLFDIIQPGAMIVGHDLHASLGLHRGDKVTLLGKEFTVAKLLPSKGSKHDMTVWVNLGEAQRLLDKPGRISAIRALECNCAAKDRLGDVRAEIKKILPDTQVVEETTQALTRAEARNTAAAAARAAVLKERKARVELRQQREEFAAILVPLVLLACTVWVGLLAFTNVRDRAGEIGILRALGVGSWRVFGLFLARAVLVGLLGALLGWTAGSLAGRWWGEEPVAAQAALFEPGRLLLVVLAAPLLCALASLVPALLAAKRDPAVVLREG